MTDRDRLTLKVVRETRQTSSETLTREFRSAMNCPANSMTVRRESRGMGFHGQAAAHTWIVQKKKKNVKQGAYKPTQVTRNSGTLQQ
jgi:hypothetical protein